MLYCHDGRHSDLHLDRFYMVRRSELANRSCVELLHSAKITYISPNGHMILTTYA